MQREFGVLDFMMRWALGQLIVLGAYNPFSMSYFHWVADNEGQLSLKVLVGVGLVVLHVIAILATIRSLGLIGVGLLTAFFASAAWVLIDGRLLDIEDPRIFQMTLLLIGGTIYGVGLSWSHLRNRISGQVDSRDVSQNSPI
jgi:hypothetical protein